MPKISALTSLAQASVDTAADVLPIVDATAPATTKKVTVQAMVNAGLATLTTLPSGIVNASISSITPSGGTLGVTGIQTITANSASAGLTVAQSGAGPAAAFTGGNVLIGTTINGVYRLDVNGPFRAGNSTFGNMDVFGIQVITANSSSPGLTVTQSGAGPCLRLTGLPTSAAGLSAGDIWNDSGTLKVA